MTIFKCKMCGGALEINNDTVAVCEYCGTRQTVSKSRDDVVSNLFNRANNLRLKCEFDKAEQVYEKILDIDNSDSEAHWGVVLCKYGIEYVEDPKTFSKIPTCHRTLYEAVLTDINYLSAIENADAQQKELYISEAKVIDELQKNILTIVNNEEPFDVFICYKETDDEGKRTVDSAIANDIYYQLTEEGFKVFYAPITLEEKLGHEYEPYIFAALNSAKVMLVVGTKPEYFDSVWVRNEWSRFIKLIKNDRSKMIIPCYRNMDAYELPDEFAHLQAQDMGKIGFITDVIRGLKKFFDRDIQPQPSIRKKMITKPHQKKPKNFSSKVKKVSKKEKLNFYLTFPAHKTSKVFYIFTLVFYLFYLFEMYLGIDIVHDFFIHSLVGLPLVPLFLIFTKVIKRKSTALIFQALSTVLPIGFGFPQQDHTYEIRGLYFLELLVMTILSIVWFLWLCFSKKKSLNEKISIKLKTYISAVVVFAALSVFIASPFTDYYFTKTLYNLESYEYAHEGFNALYSYQNSEELALKSKLSEIRNAEFSDLIDLSNYIIIDKQKHRSARWRVLASEGDKVLLLREISAWDRELSVWDKDLTILGGWKNSTVRTFLNEGYYNEAFDDNFKKHIMPTKLKNSSNAKDFTTDRIFILSEEELNKYSISNSTIILSNNGFCLRNVENNRYTYIDNYGKIQTFVYTKKSIPKEDADGDGFVSFSEWTTYRKQNYEEIDALLYRPAMWIDVSNID